MSLRELHRSVLLLIALVLLALILPNLRALYEGIFFYLRDAVTYAPASANPIRSDGRYASLYDLVRLRNADRYRYVKNQLATLNATITEIPIAPSPSLPLSPSPNLYVTFNNSVPQTIFSAHYDKLYDTDNYQGASDNSAAVSVLLAAAQESARRGDAREFAFLFTSEEERGLRGAAAFVEYARANNLPIREIITFDNIGRGGLAIRPLSEHAGFAFALPFIGEMTYDGAQFRASAPTSRVNVRLAQTLARVHPRLTVYERFTARGDANVFQERGIDSVMLSSDNMWYLQQTWHTDADRTDLLEERNLEMAYEVVMGYW